MAFSGDERSYKAHRGFPTSHSRRAAKAGMADYTWARSRVLRPCSQA